MESFVVSLVIVSTAKTTSALVMIVPKPSRCVCEVWLVRVCCVCEVWLVRVC